jgi:hypothetical protein
VDSFEHINKPSKTHKTGAYKSRAPRRTGD